MQHNPIGHGDRGRTDLSFLPSTLFVFRALGVFIPVFFNHGLNNARFNPQAGEMPMKPIEAHYLDD